jgi:WD40 repeat protein
MNFPSPEFSETVSRLCVGTASEGDIAGLHALLRSNPAAQDEYLWQVELHARLAQSAASPALVSVVPPREAGSANDRITPARTSRRSPWASIAALLAVALGAGWWMLREAPRLLPTQATPSLRSAAGDGKGLTGGASLEGVYRTTVRFAIAADAPVIAGTGRAEPIALGAEVPLEQGGHTLHVWDWSKSPMSRVFKDTRLWPDEVFAVSPDGKTLVWANGKILDLVSGEQSKIDLGGALYLDHLGGHLQRIVHVQFTRAGRNLALLLSNVALTKSAHPLRKQDFSTSQTMQVVTYPEGKLVCEFPAGYRMAWSDDGSRAAGGFPPDQSPQQIVETSALTGEVLRKYEPRLREFTYATAYSPDGSRLAAFDSAGELLIWDATNGELKHRIAMKESSPGDLRFSPDGKLLAISLIQKTRVIDVAGGTLVAAIPQETPGLIRWTPDSQAFDVISNVIVGSISERQNAAGQTIVYNVFPTLKRWNLEEFRKK